MRETDLQICCMTRRWSISTIIRARFPARPFSILCTDAKARDSGVLKTLVIAELRHTWVPPSGAFSNQCGRVSVPILAVADEPHQTPPIRLACGCARQCLPI
jgi:hypothetical protein